MFKRFKGIRRLNQTTDPQLLGDGEVQVLENMVLDSTYNKAIKRGGIINNSYGEIGSGSTPTLFSAVVDNVDYILAKNGFKLMKKSTGAFSEVGTNIFTDTNKIDHTQYRDQIYMVGEGEAPKMTDLTNVFNLGVDRPDISSLVVGSGTATSGLTLDAEYKYILTYVTEMGEESRQSNPFTYHISLTNPFSTKATTNTSLRIGYGNTMPVSPDTRVKSINIYRTKANSNTYYFLVNVDNAATEYVDLTADTELGSKTLEYQNLPVETKFCEMHKSRLFLANLKIKSDNLIVPAKAAGTYKFSGSANIGGPDIYKYMAIFTTFDGVKSDPVYSSDVYTDGQIGIGGEYVDLSLVPTFGYYGSAELELAGIKREVYRTTRGGTTYKRLNLSDANDITDRGFSDNTLDADLGDAYEAQPSVEYDSSIVCSEVGKPSEFQALNIIRIYPDDGDVITGIKDDLDGLLVFKENSICKIYTQGNPLNWRVVKLIDNIGCDTPFSIQRAGNTYYYAYKNKIYRYPNELISAQVNLIDNFKGSAYFNNWYVYLTQDTDTSPYSSAIYIFDEIAQSWYVFKAVYFDASDVAKIFDDLVFASSNSIANSYAIEYSDNLYDFFENDTLNNGTITAKITFPKLIVNGLKNKFRMIRLLSRYTKLASKAVTHKINLANYTDTSSSGVKNLEKTIGLFNSSFTHAKSLEYTIYGEGLSSFDVAELEFNETRRAND